MRRPLIVIALTSVLATGVIAAPPAVASGAQAIADCNAHAQLTGTYSVADLQNALSTMPGDVKEYTNCYDVIQRALLAKLGGGSHTNGSDPGSGGSFLPTPLIIVLVFLILGAGGYGVAELRRRRRS